MKYMFSQQVEDCILYFAVHDRPDCMGTLLTKVHHDVHGYLVRSCWQATLTFPRSINPHLRSLCTDALAPCIS